jgi:copper chaperone NosL
VAVGLAGLLLLLTFLSPLWRIKMFAQQFPDGLELRIYPQQLVGGHEGNDLNEINVLNHYIGMQTIQQQDFFEMKWIPFAIGVFLLLGLRTAVFGKLGNMVDLTVLFSYFGLFSLYSFYSKLHWYGHHLNPEAAVKVPPFTPPLLGKNQLANFTVYSLPGWGTLFMALYGAVLVGVLLQAWRSHRGQPA